METKDSNSTPDKSVIQPVTAQAQSLPKDTVGSNENADKAAGDSQETSNCGSSDLARKYDEDAPEELRK